MVGNTLPLLLLGWFVVLAVAEGVAALPRDQHNASGDGRLLTNFALTAIALAASSLLPLARMTSSLFGERLGIGVTNLVPLPWIATIAMLLILDSFAAYWLHRLMHATPLLWRIHRVHHADTALDLSTSLRNHPLELLLTVPVSSLIVLLIGAPVFVVVAAQTVSVAATMWQHADIALPRRLDAALARAIITPRLHRLHHNPERQVHDTNFGASITLWDWIFGTLNLSAGRHSVGLQHQVARADNLLDQIWSPLQSA